MNRKHKNNWDNRYDEDRYFYGEEPNYFVKRELPSQPVGRGLFLAEWDLEQWDFVVLCFAHLPPEVMPGVHRRVSGCLKPGGRVFLVSFAKSQFGRKSGGPPRLEWLHDVGELRQEFAGLEWDRLVECEADLRESVGHIGEAMVIEGVGGKN